jgi:flagellar hook-associated protein 3 FlgL
MRISTSQIYETGANNIQRSQSALYKLQNQMSTGRRILTPSDDPVAAAQALIVTQSSDVNAQHVDNQGNASAQLGLVDNQLSSLTNLLQNIRDQVVTAGNPTLGNSDRQSIATELEANLADLLGIANSQNGTGEYLFSGYQGATKPFAMGASGTVTYSGDDGERLLQVASSRQMAVNVAGSDLFMNAKNGNGTFVAATGGNGIGNNKGTATIDAGSVLDQQQWQKALNGYPWLDPDQQGLKIEFTSATTYQLYDVADTAIPPTPLLTTDATFVPGKAISLSTTTVPATSFGAQVVIQGQPEAGDTFTVEPSSNQSLFQTVQSLIGILRTPVGSTTYKGTQLSNDLAGQLTNIDQAMNNVSRVQTTVGAQMRELDSLESMSSDLKVQYQAVLSDLQDLDYAKAASDFIMQQTNLEAAQKSFVQISGLSLFNYL